MSRVLDERSSAADGFAVEVDSAAVDGGVSAGCGRVIRVSGQIDAATAGALADCLASLMGSGAGHIDVDLTRTSFCGVAGLDVLLTAASTLQMNGGRLVVHQPCWSLRRLTALLDADHALELVPAAP